MDIEKNVKRTLKKISLKKSDKIIVALSGGKDSTTTAYLLKKFGYNIEGIFIDLCVDNYSKSTLKIIEDFCSKFKIKLSVYNLKKEQGNGMNYFWKKNKNINRCGVCGVFKKWILNKEAHRLNAKFLATGHNLDDETETILLNVFKGDLELGVKSGIITKNISNKKFVPRIKPLFYCENQEIKKFAENNKIKFARGICPYRQDSYRIEIRKFVENLTKKQKQNILNNFDYVSKKIKYKKLESKINYCEFCGEPSRKKICKKCEYCD